jgi:hypothetical protein
MKYFYENDIVKQGWADYTQLNNVSIKPINVRFCRDCPLFDINGIQPDPGIIHGRCLRFSDEHVPYYVRVDDTDFCNEDKIENEILQ